MFNWFYYLRNSIRSLLFWLPVIWQDRDWDFHYSYVIMQHKIKKQKKYLLKYGMFVGVEKEIRKMYICELLLERLIKDNYLLAAEQERRKRVLGVTRAWEYETQMQRQDQNLLYKILEKHSGKWWY